MLRARLGWSALLACGLMAAGGTVAYAAGSEVETIVKVKKASKITKKKPGKASLSWEMLVSKPDGSRPDDIHTGELTLPKGVSATAKGLKVCELSALQRNDDKSCPKKSIAGSATGQIHTPEVRAQPFDATGPIYFTGMRGKVPTFAAFYTVTDIPTLHGVTQIQITRSGKTSKVHMDQPPLPVPGLPDSTPLEIGFNFPKATTPFRMSKACKRGTSVKARFGFFPTSPASHDNSVFHTKIDDPVDSSAKAC
jgi:hypothetical protein